MNRSLTIGEVMLVLKHKTYLSSGRIVNIASISLPQLATADGTVGTVGTVLLYFTWLMDENEKVKM